MKSPVRFGLEKRISSTIELPTRLSQLTIFEKQNTPLTPDTAPQFTTEFPSRNFAKAGDPRSLVYSDAEVPAWGSQRYFNQPRFGARPLSTGSVLDFTKLREQIELDSDGAVQSPPGFYRSRNHSGDRSYEAKSWTVEPALQGNGGLVNAMRASGDVSWIGTIGFPTDDLSDSIKGDVKDHLLNEYQSEIVYINDKNLDGHYTHYCKVSSQHISPD